jgi:hypothetical protein
MGFGIRWRLWFLYAEGLATYVLRKGWIVKNDVKEELP